MTASQPRDLPSVQYHLHKIGYIICTSQYQLP